MKKNVVRIISVLVILCLALPMMVGCSMSSSRRQGEALFEIFENLFTWNTAINQVNGRLVYIAVDMSRAPIEDYDTFRELVEEFAEARDFTVLWATRDELIEDGYIYVNEDDENIVRFRKEIEDGEGVERVGGILITFFPTGEHADDPAQTPENATIYDLVDGNTLRISARKWGRDAAQGHVTANFVVERGMSSFTLTRNNPVTAT